MISHWWRNAGKVIIKHSIIAGTVLLAAEPIPFISQPATEDFLPAWWFLSLCISSSQKPFGILQPSCQTIKASPILIWCWLFYCSAVYTEDCKARNCASKLHTRGCRCVTLSFYKLFLKIYVAQGSIYFCAQVPSLLFSSVQMFRFINRCTFITYCSHLIKTI